MAQIFASYRYKFPAFVAVHCCFGGLHVTCRAGLDFDETQDVFVPGNQVDFPAADGRTEVMRNDDVSVSSQVKVRIFFPAPARAEMFSKIVGRQESAR